METIGESGGLMPHPHPHHRPIPGSGYFPQKDSPASYFFPKASGGQSSYHGSYSHTETEIHGMMFGQQSRKGGGRGGGNERRIGGGVSAMSGAGSGSGGGESRYHLPSSSISSSISSSSLSSSPHHQHKTQQQQQHSLGSSYHHHHHHQQQQQQLPSPIRGAMSQFVSPLQHNRYASGDDTKPTTKMPDSMSDVASSRLDQTLTPEKRLGKDEFSPLKKSSPYDNNNPLINSPYYFANKQGRQPSSGYANEARHANFETSVYPEMRESVKDVYESFSNGRNKEDMNKPEAIPIAYDDSDMQSQMLSSQHFRERLERSTSQDPGAGRAGNMASHSDFPYDSDHRPRAITLNSMSFNRRDIVGGERGGVQNSFYASSKNHDVSMYQKMRDHFNQTNNMNKPYNFYRHAGRDKELMPPLSPSSLTNSSFQSGHQRRLSGGDVSGRAPSSQDMANHAMMAPPGKFHSQEGGHLPFPPPMNHGKQSHHQQYSHHTSLQQLDKEQPISSVQNLGKHNDNNDQPPPPARRKSFDLIDDKHNLSTKQSNPVSSDNQPSNQSLFEGRTAKSPGTSPGKEGRRPFPLNESGSPAAKWTSFKMDSSNPDRAKSLQATENDTPDSNFLEKSDGNNRDQPKSSSATKDDDDAVDGNTDDTQMPSNFSSSSYNNNNNNTDNTSNPSKEDSSSTVSLKGESPPPTPPRKLSSDSPDDNCSLPDALPRELMPKKEMFSDEGEDDSYHSSGHYPPMTPPSPGSAGIHYPPFQRPFFPSPPERFPSQVQQQQQQQHPHHHNPFGPHAHMGIPDGGQGIPPGFPFGKDMHGRFPMPGIGREMSMGPGGPTAFMGQMPVRMDGEKDVYFCHLCSYSGKSKSDFDAHMSIHFEYNCPHCDYTSRTEGRLKRHIKDFHTDDSTRRSMPGRPKVFKCKQCSFSATEKDKFWEHARSHIKEDKLLQCPKCPFVTEYKHHLEYHLRNHFGSKPFKCNKCNYSCVNKSMLNSHMKSHTNVYQYRCSDCTYATKYCHSLKLHLRKYNHKPATVLNQDGSLPQGMDADASGLSVNTKRGPPRGPRGPRKDKNDAYFGQMFGVPPMGMGMPPAMNPMLKGMMPFWPVLQHGMPAHPGMLPGLPGIPQHMGVRGDAMEMRDRQGGMDRGDHDMNGRLSGEESPGKDEEDSAYLPCRLCDFIGDSTEALCLHLLQVHKDETGEMASMYGINEAALAESMERAKRAKMEKSGQRIERRMSEMSADSEKEISDYRRRNTIAGLLSRGENPDFPMGGGVPNKAFWSSSFDQRGNGKHGGRGEGGPRIQDLCYVDDGNDDIENKNDSNIGGMDILQQMTLKFGGVNPAGRSKSLEPDDRNVHSLNDEDDIGRHRNEDKTESQRRPPGQKESPLDLTKPKSESPPMFSNPSSPRRLDDFNSEEDEIKPHVWMDSSRGSELDKLTENLVRKRQISELEENNGLNTAGTAQRDHTPQSYIVPRKRSRKGKAYKLETLCMKLQEHIPRSPHDSEADSEENEAMALEKRPESMTRQVSNENQRHESNDEDAAEKCSKLTEEKRKDDEEEEEEEGIDGALVVSFGKTEKSGVIEVGEIKEEMKDDEGEEERMDVDEDNAMKNDGTYEMKEEKVVKTEREDDSKNETENEKSDGDSGGDNDKADKTTEKEEELENFEKLQETLNSFNEKIKQENCCNDQGEKAGDDVPSKEKNSRVIKDNAEKISFQFENNEDNDNINVNVNDIDDDDDDDDAKTEILGEEEHDVDKDVFDLSDKENSSDVYTYGGQDVIASPEKTPVATEDVEIEEKVDMINTVIENRKKPLPPAVRRGTELAWKLLNDPVNPVTSIPIPVVSPPPADWNSHSQPSSPIASTSSIPTSPMMGGGYMGSPIKNGVRMSLPFSPAQRLPPPPPKPHLPIPLPPTPMAFIPPTNRIMPEHQMPLPPPPQLPPVAKQHAPKDMYECTYCDLSFRDCVMYTVHMGYHSNRNPFKCNSCGIICRDKVEFFLHIARSPHS